MTVVPVKIALITEGAPTFPDEPYAVIPFPLGDQMTVENAIYVVQAQIAEGLGYIRMVAPEAPVKGWVLCDSLGLRLLCESVLRAEGIRVTHEAR